MALVIPEERTIYMPISTEGSCMPTMRPTTALQSGGGGGGGGLERTIYMPISTEGSGMPTMRPTTGSPVWGCGGGGVGKNYLHAHIHWRFRHAYHETNDCSPVWGVEGGVEGGGWKELFTCPYPLKVQARLPWDQRLLSSLGVGGVGGGGLERTIDMPISTEGSGTPTMRPTTALRSGKGWRELFTCPYPLKVQAYLPWDQRLALQSGGVEGGGWGWRELFTCPYPLKVQAYLPWDQRLALQSGGVEGGWVERTIYMPISTEGSSMPTMRSTTGSPVWRGGGGVGVENYLHAHIHWRFRHAYHETKDWLSGPGSWGAGGERMNGANWNFEKGLKVWKKRYVLYDSSLLRVT